MGVQCFKAGDPVEIHTSDDPFGHGDGWYWGVVIEDAGFTATHVLIKDNDFPDAGPQLIPANRVYHDLLAPKKV